MRELEERGGDGIEERWVRWKRGRGGDKFEGCETFKGERVERKTWRETTRQSKERRGGKEGLNLKGKDR